ncbi:MAG TPA: GspH/FimT family pseudopilin [Candidatus Binatia bacterium]|jgi:Tfp pilus assembly protein FimT|nr:GspH/FimT family pseudopilin [Candidatus Binatia bacterium]
MVARSSGFTVVELMACTALLAVVVGTTVVRLPPLVASVRLAGAAHRLAAVLRQARGRALERNTRMEIHFDSAARRWDVREFGGLPLEAQALPDGVSFTTLPAGARVRFSTIGTADNATITLAAGSGSRRVVVNQRGRVRVQ